MSDLSGKTALVTGASSGIGRAIARILDENGVRVTLTARREDRLNEAAAGLEFANCVVADFRDETQISAAVRQTAETRGRLDILVNSAGLAKQAGLSDGATRDWREMLETNVLGLAIASREALQFFDSREGGHIVNICSMSGHRIPGKGGFYAATKFAVRAMTEGLRQELRLAGNPTRVSQISPGFVDTELLDIYFQSAGSDRYAAVDYPILKPEDIAKTVLHVLSAPPHVDVTDVLVRPTAQDT